MNWFTFKTFGAASESTKVNALTKCSNVCEHVEEDPNKLYIIHTENDSFGGEHSAYCKECDDEIKKQTDESEECCTDCGKTFTAKELTTWSWYDFCAAQGDMPHRLCGDCLNGDKHKARTEADYANYMQEVGLYDKQSSNEAQDDNVDWQVKYYSDSSTGN